jgi:hypothetical protein
MNYTKPEVVRLGAASSAIQGAKGGPYVADLQDPKSTIQSHTLNAYEADE